MHEMMFAQRILREARKAGAEKFVKVEVGELCEIGANELNDGLVRLSSGVLDAGEIPAFGVLSASVGTLDFSDEKMEFEVNEVLSKVKCDCGFVGRARIVDRGHGYCLFDCPECGGKVDVLEGGEIKIVGVA